MSPTMVAVRAGARRGRIEFRQAMTSPQDVWGVMFFPVIAIVVMYLLRGSNVPGTGFSLGPYAIPGILGMNVMMNGMMSVGLSLTFDREDGTLLRAKATPNGMTGYLTGKVLGRAGTTLVGVLAPLVLAAWLFDGLETGRASSWAVLAWVLALALLATLPLGTILGSLFDNAQNLGVVMLPMMVLLAISGIFYPVTALPAAVQWIAQVFPLYWLGLGLRSALLPDALAAAEIGGSWRHLETAGVLGAWAVLGLALAPTLLRRMARRESGSRVAARRTKAVQRTV